MSKGEKLFWEWMEEKGYSVFKDGNHLIKASHFPVRSYTLVRPTKQMLMGSKFEYLAEKGITNMEFVNFFVEGIDEDLNDKIEELSKG
jgi:hypothetical protein